jgi:hypothetical protein
MENILVNLTGDWTCQKKVSELKDKSTQTRNLKKRKKVKKNE